MPTTSNKITIVIFRFILITDIIVATTVKYTKIVITVQSSVGGEVVIQYNMIGGFGLLLSGLKSNEI